MEGGLAVDGGEADRTRQREVRQGHGQNHKGGQVEEEIKKKRAEAGSGGATCRYFNVRWKDKARPE